MKQHTYSTSAAGCAAYRMVLLGMADRILGAERGGIVGACLVHFL